MARHRIGPLGGATACPAIRIKCLTALVTKTSLRRLLLFGTCNTARIFAVSSPEYNCGSKVLELRKLCANVKVLLHFHLCIY
jgi:hypothetical protein